MKNIPLILIFTILFGWANAQTCKIKLSSDDGKKIRFLIKIKDTNKVLKSDSVGVLVVADSILAKYGDIEIIFSYHHNLDNEYYREPQYTRKNHSLLEACGQVLFAKRRD